MYRSSSWFGVVFGLRTTSSATVWCVSQPNALRDRGSPRSTRLPMQAMVAQGHGGRAFACSRPHTRAYQLSCGLPWRALRLHERTRRKSTGGIWWSSDMIAPNVLIGKPLGFACDAGGTTFGTLDRLFSELQQLSTEKTWYLEPFANDFYGLEGDCVPVYTNRAHGSPFRCSLGSSLNCITQNLWPRCQALSHPTYALPARSAPERSSPTMDTSGRSVGAFREPSMGYRSTT
jgi:hypothetical protein